jgi:PIN domain nuclease of toxin-antitoxin system
VILLDTHIWIWWVQDLPKLSAAQLAYLRAAPPNSLGVSVYSVWEVAMLVDKGRITFQRPVADWVRVALSVPDIQLLDLTPEIAIESIFLPGMFHKDPADRILVATARILDISIVTQDAKILAYPHVRCAP